MKNGTIDLENWTYEKKIDLNGEWEFYPNQLLDPREISLKPSSFTEVPSFLEGEGYDSFCLTIKTKTQRPQLAIKIGLIYSSYTLFVNGKQKLSAGITGTTKETSMPRSKFDYALLDEGIIKAQKDTDARWTKKNQETFYGYKDPSVVHEFSTTTKSRLN